MYSLGLCTACSFVHGKVGYKIITEENLQLNVYVMTALIDMYAKWGSIAEAQSIFFFFFFLRYKLRAYSTEWITRT
jgi:hypothetical protein